VVRERVSFDALAAVFIVDQSVLLCAFWLLRHAWLLLTEQPRSAYRGYRPLFFLVTRFAFFFRAAFFFGRDRVVFRNISPIARYDFV